MRRGYLLGVGSNLNPERNSALIIEGLLAAFGRLSLSRIYYTAPVEIASPQAFVNFCAFIPTTLPEAAFKARCVALEIALGRDRNNPLRKILDRPADLDVLATGDALPTVSELPAYIRQPCAELVALLGGFALPQAQGSLCRVFAFGRFLGETPTTIDRDDGSGLVGITEY